MKRHSSHTLHTLDYLNLRVLFDIWPIPIILGTLWCGDGDIATKYQDLGYHKLTDACCRGHDNCEDFIPAGEEKYGLQNTGLFTRLVFIFSQVFRLTKFDCLQINCKAYIIIVFQVQLWMWLGIL